MFLHIFNCLKHTSGNLKKSVRLWKVITSLEIIFCLHQKMRCGSSYEFFQIYRLAYLLTWFSGGQRTKLRRFSLVYATCRWVISITYIYKILWLYEANQIISHSIVFHKSRQLARISAVILANLNFFLVYQGRYCDRADHVNRSNLHCTISSVSTSTTISFRASQKYANVRETNGSKAHRKWPVGGAWYRVYLR